MAISVFFLRLIPWKVHHHPIPHPHVMAQFIPFRTVGKWYASYKTRSYLLVKNPDVFGPIFFLLSCARVDIDIIEPSVTFI